MLVWNFVDFKFTPNLHRDCFACVEMIDLDDLTACRLGRQHLLPD